MKKIALKFLNKTGLKRFTFTVFTCVAVIAVILQTPQIIDAREILDFNRNPQNYNANLLILDRDNKTVAKFSIAIAESEEHKIYGLMNLDVLPQDFGMLFPFTKSQIILMWMKNTRIALDMIFIDKNNVITNIKHNAKPYSLDLISSETPAKKVLEINGGLAQKLGIKIGQQVKQQ